MGRGMLMWYARNSDNRVAYGLSEGLVGNNRWIFSMIKHSRPGTQIRIYQLSDWREPVKGTEPGDAPA